MTQTVDSITEELRVCNEQVRDLERRLSHAIFNELSPTDTLVISMLSTMPMDDLTPALASKAHCYPKLFTVDVRETPVRIELTSIGRMIAKLVNTNTRHLYCHCDGMVSGANNLSSKLEDTVSQIVLNVRVYSRQARAIQLLADDEINPNADTNLLDFISGYYNRRTNHVTPLGRLVYNEVMKTLADYGLDLNELARD